MGFDVDSVLEKLLSVRGQRAKTVVLEPSEISALGLAARDVFMAQPPFLELEAPVKICGDVHGQYGDLLRLFDTCAYPPDANYLYLGDYVDRGKQGFETICLLLAYKVKYPHNFFMLRGNHECAAINRIYGFYDECKRRFTIKTWKAFTDIFNTMPLAAVVSERIFACHGGLSPELVTFTQIQKISRPADVSDQGLACDLLWADPEVELEGWGDNERGVSVTFGANVVAEFLERHDLDMVVRAHQVVEDGFQFFADRQLITLFSAPNYCGEFNNAGGIMSIDEHLTCSFQVLKPLQSGKGRAYATQRMQQSHLNEAAALDNNGQSLY
eukprot:TRINITY_DN2533_c0_g1_i6.p1 TRINITY_DN2533_c0_g1~~TRINITY_DN2533_c0_g1_i6.p1  ORF type:complete len:327 (+),score=138.01 TRINITY_DN2533_c0_g1_i6:67-1047(+)